RQSAGLLVRSARDAASGGGHAPAGLDRWRDVIGTMRAVLMLTGAPRCRTFLDALGPQQAEGLYGRPMRHAAHSQP
ncbi:hypothetical protein, partial [Ralstonia pseudosolanacearum]